MLLSAAILQLIFGCALLAIVVGVPSVLILKRVSKILSYHQAAWVIFAAYLISLLFLIGAYLVSSYFNVGDSLIGIAWLFVFGYSITKLSEKNYGVLNTKFPAVGAQVVFWFVLMTWVVTGIVWLIYYAASKL